MYGISRKKAIHKSYKVGEQKNRCYRCQMKRDANNERLEKLNKNSFEKQLIPRDKIL